MRIAPIAQKRVGRRAPSHAAVFALGNHDADHLLAVAAKLGVGLKFNA